MGLNMDEPMEKTGFPDEYFMNRTIVLAQRWAGRTDPNPMVGAVLVKNGRIISEGGHERSGGRHAEIAAIESTGESTHGCTLYVNLEPCCHYGRTPPCTDRIIASGINKVVIATLDPYPEVNGVGRDKLREAGIEVIIGVSTAEAIMLNLAYFRRYIKRPIPSVTLKVADSIDGGIAPSPGAREAITGPESREFTHRLRAVNQSILVGINTLLTDEPKLDCRLLEGVEAPVPVVLDSRFKFPKDHYWLKSGRKFFVCTTGSPGNRVFETPGHPGPKVLVCEENEGRVDIASALAALSSEGIESVLVEGGSQVFTSFIKSGLWDALYVFMGPVFFGEDSVRMFHGCTPEQLNAVPVGASRLGRDFVLAYMNNSVYETFCGFLI